MLVADDAQTISANVYPSLEGLTLYYESSGVKDDPSLPKGKIREFTFDEGKVNTITYTFEAMEDKEDENKADPWLFQRNSYRPSLKLDAQGVKISYLLDVPEENPNDKPGMEPSQPNGGGMGKAEVRRKAEQLTPEEQAQYDDDMATSREWREITEDRPINLRPLALTESENQSMQASFILEKNGASTPMRGGDSDMSEHIVTLIKGQSDLTDVEAIPDSEAEVIYYDLNGFRVNADRLEKGIYIKVQGKSVSKIRH